MSSSKAIGIDLGTTYSRVGGWQNDRVEIITNDRQGNRTTPSYVSFSDNERLIGDAAKKQVAMNPTNPMFDAKRLYSEQLCTIHLSARQARSTLSERSNVSRDLRLSPRSVHSVPNQISPSRAAED
ncbi:Hsp70 protein-domain-containing protein [Favolaschia claudopus]|uniref:Hsp70 protein-domain-containing protein n=1 Tax=Favolaschia claudopus TaxID=2862362 RepID=A0AAW0A6L6_9AGAR